MNRKGLAVLMRTKIRVRDGSRLLSSSFTGNFDQEKVERPEECSTTQDLNSIVIEGRTIKIVRESMHMAIHADKIDIIDTSLQEFSEGYFNLSREERRYLLLVLAKEYDVNRIRVHELMEQYLDRRHCGLDEEGLLSAFYRIERNLRLALKPKYEILFEKLNTCSGGLKFLSHLRADILSIIEEDNVASMRALDAYLKEKLVTWLSPASLELHHITWDDPASLLEKIVIHEAVHPINDLLDLKRRLGPGRRCFGYLHPSIPGEPLIFIEVAFLENVARSIKEILWDNRPLPEAEATCALFYSISSTQSGLTGINLGKFLIKRVVELLKREMPHISTFATLSPIPGFVPWLLSKLTSQLRFIDEQTMNTERESFVSSFIEIILYPDEDKALLELPLFSGAKNGMEVMMKLMTSYDWINSDRISEIIQPPLLRLCARYIYQEKRRGKALDAVANFHLQNGAMIGCLNWMADQSEKCLHQSGGIMVNYVYRLDTIEENARSYLHSGLIEASHEFKSMLRQSHI